MAFPAAAAAALKGGLDFSGSQGGSEADTLTSGSAGTGGSVVVGGFNVPALPTSPVVQAALVSAAGLIIFGLLTRTKKK